MFVLSPSPCERVTAGGERGCSHASYHPLPMQKSNPSWLEMRRGMLNALHASFLAQLPPKSCLRDAAVSLSKFMASQGRFKIHARSVTPVTSSAVGPTLPTGWHIRLVNELGWHWFGMFFNPARAIGSFPCHNTNQGQSWYQCDVSPCIRNTEIYVQHATNCALPAREALSMLCVFPLCVLHEGHFVAENDDVWCWWWWSEHWFWGAFLTFWCSN